MVLLGSYITDNVTAVCHLFNTVLAVTKNYLPTSISPNSDEHLFSSVSLLSLSQHPEQNQVRPIITSVLNYLIVCCQKRSLLILECNIDCFCTRKVHQEMRRLFTKMKKLEHHFPPLSVVF